MSPHGPLQEPDPPGPGRNGTPWGLRHPGIRTKIFGLAGVLLALTVFLALFLLRAAEGTRRQLAQVLTLDLPLAEALDQVNEAGLRRRLAFERQVGVLNGAVASAEIIQEAQSNYGRFSESLAVGFARSRALLGAYPSGEAQRPELVEIRLGIDQLEAAYGGLTARQEQILALLRAGAREEAIRRLELLNDVQRSLQDQRSRLAQCSGSMSRARARDVEARQQGVRRLAFAATLSTVLLGLLLAALITERLTRPVLALTSALDGVRAGRLDQELPVLSRDEVGELTRAYNFFISELRAKAHLKAMFGRYVDPRVLEHLLEGPEAGVLRGERRTLTVGFGDLMGFTALSERLSPAVMVAVLNRHFGLQAEAVQAAGGVVDKFIGDAVMAFWGPPFSAAETHAAQACHAALSQVAAMGTLRGELPELTGLRKDPPRLDMCVGLGTGEVVVGNIGSDQARSFTVIGDAVNRASRIEAVNRQYGTRILVDGATAQAAGGAFAFREVDALRFKGKSEVTHIYELRGLSTERNPETSALLETYAQALARYRARDWAGAEAGFLECLTRVPEDGPSRVLLQRVVQFKVEPPGSDWEGVHTLLEK